MTDRQAQSEHGACSTTDTTVAVWLWWLINYDRVLYGIPNLNCATTTAVPGANR